MAVHVIPGGFLKRRFPQDAIVVEDGAGKTAREIMRALDIPCEAVPVILINGRSAPQDTTLSDGDVLKLLPLLGGG